MIVFRLTGLALAGYAAWRVVELFNYATTLPFP